MDQLHGLPERQCKCIVLDAIVIFIKPVSLLIIIDVTAFSVIIFDAFYVYDV